MATTRCQENVQRQRHCRHHYFLDLPLFRTFFYRASADIFCFTRRTNRLLTQLSLIMGASGPFIDDNRVSTDATFQDIQDKLKDENHVAEGDIIINTASMPLKSKGRTNMLKIHVVE